MLNKKSILEILRVGAILFAITAVSAAILAVANRYTAPVIAHNKEKAQIVAMEKVLPGAVNFENTHITPEGIVTELYTAEQGFVVMVSPKGYGGEISMAVGIGTDLSVTGVEVISQSETAGLGANCANPEFLEKYIGKTENIAVVKNAASGNEVDAITSATITTKAVTKGVNEAISYVKKIEEVK